MGDFLTKLFVDVDALPSDAYGFIQVIFLGACYLYILLLGANMIGDGSELLMLIPSLAGVVGSVILPVLGAVPDGAIVLFSGLGPDAASQVQVGVGALAGSTVMLLTIPWFLSIVGGRVPLGPVQGGARMKPLYGKRDRSDVPLGCLSTGVGPDASIRKNAMVMMITCLPCYLMVEIPALIFINENNATAAAHIRPFALVGALICAIMFVGYIAYQYRLSKAGASETASANSLAPLLEQRVNNVMIKAIKAGRMGLRALLMEQIRSAGAASGQALLSSPAQDDLQAKLKKIVRPFFHKFDSDCDGKLSRMEMSNLVRTLGEEVTPAELEHLFTTVDSDGSGEVDFNEFVSWMVQLVQKEQSPHVVLRTRTTGARMMNVVSADEAGAPATGSLPGSSAEDAEDGEDDEVEVPEDILNLNLPPDEQRARVLRRAFWQMGVGTFLVLLFSDPMVDVLDSIGKRTNIAPFFIAFLLGPVASNASEMVASYQYAQRKSEKTISVAFAQLLGAACMNNTFCLLIFYLLIAARGLNWTYHAEVIGIIFAELCMAVMASRRVHTVRDGAIVLSLLPATLVVVACLKGTVFKRVEG